MVSVDISKIQNISKSFEVNNDLQATITDPNGYIVHQTANHLEGEFLTAKYTSALTNWTSTIGVTTEFIKKDMEVAQWFAILIGITCIILSMLISHFLSIMISNPIKEFIQKMELAGKGEFQTRMRQYEWDRDINALYRGFDTMVAQIDDLIKEVYTSEIHKKEAQLRALQHQINPHFLYNVLLTIDCIAEVE